jgi:hypothetical protein
MLTKPPRSSFFARNMDIVVGGGGYTVIHSFIHLMAMKTESRMSKVERRNLPMYKLPD